MAGNFGSADSGATAMTTALDPNQSVIVDTPIPTGLQVRRGHSPSRRLEGGICFDPDCQVRAVIDPDDLILEADETNNELCRESSDYTSLR